MFKSSLRGVILLTSGAKARKWSNLVSLTSFSRPLEPRPESAQIIIPELILPTSGANARKLSNLAAKMLFYSVFVTLCNSKVSFHEVFLTLWNAEVSFYKVLLTCVHAEV